MTLVNPVPWENKSTCKYTSGEQSVACTGQYVKQSIKAVDVEVYRSAIQHENISYNTFV